MDASNTTFIEDLCPECGGFPDGPHVGGCSMADEVEDPAARLESLAGVDLVIYLSTLADAPLLRVPVDTLDAFAAFPNDLLTVRAAGEPDLDATAEYGTVDLPPRVALHIVVERRRS